MNLNFMPYNYWILYAAIVLFLLFCVITAAKALHLLHAVKAEKPQADSIQRNITLAKIKVDAMQEKKTEDTEKNKRLSLLIPILLAIKHTYDNDDQLNGAKGMATAATRVVRSRNEQKKMFDQFVKFNH